MTPAGGRSKLGWAAPPERVDVLLDLSLMHDVLEHVAGDLVVRVQAGVPMARLAEVLAKAGQELALDVPFPEATVGGTLAAPCPGPRAYRYGNARDLLIGVTVVLADGTVAKAGGKVVKNVAGYDLGKLFTGSYGTLGVIAEATFRLHPIPAERCWLTFECEGWEDAGVLLQVPARTERRRDRPSRRGAGHGGGAVRGAGRAGACGLVARELLGGGEIPVRGPVVVGDGRRASRSHSLRCRVAAASPDGDRGTRLARHRRLPGRRPGRPRRVAARSCPATPGWSGLSGEVAGDRWGPIRRCR